MDIKEFIAQTISETVNGMEAASRLTGRRVRFARNNENIDFDIAFVLEDGHSKEGAAGLNIKIVSVGGKTGASSINTSTQRMKFSVEVGNKKRLEEELDEAQEKLRIEEIRRRKQMNSAK